MILSIIIITHNQEGEFCRCINSILEMNLPFEYEIIVSDDASTDGTWELIMQYQSEHPTIIKGFQCNSDVCKPAMISERAGFNRINGLRHSSGKYIVHVDSDDYFRNRDCIKKQIIALSNHPECTICCQQYYLKEDYQSEGEEHQVLPKELFKDETVIGVNDFIRKIPYIHNSACCIRRTNDIDINKLNGYEYDDTDITFQYIGKGKVILIDGGGFVYCHHSSASASNFQSEAQPICWLTPISLSIIAPQCTGSLLRNGLEQITHVLKLIIKGIELDDQIVTFLSKSPAFIFSGVQSSSSFFQKQRYILAFLWIQIIRKFGIKGDWAFRVLYRLSINVHIPQEALFSPLM